MLEKIKSLGKWYSLAAQKAVKELEMYKRWPMPDVEIRKDITFLFVACPPRSGSTVFAKVLANRPGASVLHKKGEGQWLIRGMCERDRWEGEKDINYESVGRVWSKRINKIEDLSGSKVNIVVEKSPPNISRLEDIKEEFDNSKFVTFNRNPIACCSSGLKHQNGYEKSRNRRNILKKLAKSWISRSKRIMEFGMKNRLKSIKYEDFCEKTKKSASKVYKMIKKVKSSKSKIDHEYANFPVDRVKNMNDKQISNLSEKDIRCIFSVLKESRKVVKYFGYSNVLEEYS